MSLSQSFEKVGECLYSDSSSGKYYALVKIRGKQIKRSLGTDHLPEARRKLKDFKRDVDRPDPQSVWVTLRQLADKFEATFQHLSQNTRDNKGRVLERIRETWPVSTSPLLGLLIKIRLPNGWHREK